MEGCLGSHVLLASLSVMSAGAGGYELGEHPRIFVNRSGLRELVVKSGGSCAKEYAEIKARADAAVADGIEPSNSRFRVPIELVSLGITYLIERESGRESARYAQAVTEFWGDGQVLSREGTGRFGYFAMVYDWIYDAMTVKERLRFGNALGQWLRWYTDTPEITLRNGSWWYNQTWGPAHLNTPNTRDGIAPKLFVALALAGAGTDHDVDARRFLDSWAERVPAECVPAFDQMGGVWSESMGHGSYGPVAVIPWAFEAWRTATGQDLFAACSPTGFTREMTLWAVHLTMPYCNLTAWIDDNTGVDLQGFARVAPILGARYRDPVANWISDIAPPRRWRLPRWHRFLFIDPGIGGHTPGEQGYPLARHFVGAGHVHARSSWDDPNATWAFLGAGPRVAAHARDDEGHFLVAKRGLLVGRAGGAGHNDRDYYTGGSLAFNVVTIYDPDEQFRRLTPGTRELGRGGTRNENDGGMIRHVYKGHERLERGRIVAFQHDDQLTYAAADLTEAYRKDKVRELTRQFLYLRGTKEFFVVFDRVDATDAGYAKTWFLHIPSEPTVNGEATVEVPDHVVSYRGDTSTWVSSPAGVDTVLSTGRSRAFLRTLLPTGATIVKRGGKGHDFWGHPREPTAQHNHAGAKSESPPVVPWRLEVEGPGQSERGYFLHVLEVTDEGQAAATQVHLVEKAGRVGARIGEGDDAMTVWFTTAGEPTTWVQSRGAEERLKTVTE